MKMIPLTQGKSAIVDDDIYDYLMQWKWHAFLNNNKNYYAIRGNRREGRVPMHRVVAKTPAGMITDHINRNTLDNRRENLRICTRAENARNTDVYKNNKSGFRGVYWKTREKKYIAQIKVNGEIIRVGRFDSPEEAARAYDEAAVRYFGEFANLNFPT